MNTQNENANYDFQSFDAHPTAPIFPAGWDLSALLSAPEPDSAPKAEDPAENESC
ncbi:MAG: hypothetical protein HYZ22_17815 [Chloroflexi bacterium]|nr:hypothetical protein [Chloroflexota bacterium]